MSESIDVISRFHRRSVQPTRFRYAGRVHTVARILYTWVTREGRFPVHHFTVLTQDGNRYEMSLHTYTMGWTLQSDDPGAETPAAGAAS
jgi:hypothetical protein